MSCFKHQKTVWGKTGWTGSAGSLLLLLAAGLALSGCSTAAIRKKQYCKTLNIYQKGLRGGKSGRASRFDSYAEKCSKYGIPLDKAEYLKGRDSGLKAFCVKEKGFEAGLKGEKYLNVCPKAAEELFLAGYREGDKKCLYESGRGAALNGRPSSFSESRCLKLKGSLNEREYKKGYKAGLKEFCVYKKGYDMGLAGSSYNNICPKNQAAKFMAGYKKGAAKCLYESGREAARAGWLSSFSESRCLKLKGSLNEREYKKGYKAGLKEFCVYKSGYMFGLEGKKYQNICPKKTENAFFKGYTEGLQEYKRERQRQQMLALERERMEREQRAREEKLQIERERMEAEKALLESSRENLRLQRIRSYGYRICVKDSDCGNYLEWDCRYKSLVNENVCVRHGY